MKKKIEVRIIKGKKEIEAFKKAASECSRPQKEAKEVREKVLFALKDKGIIFTLDELKKHDERVAHRAYRAAALCTFQKLALINEKPILKALKDLDRYLDYLAKAYDL